MKTFYGVGAGRDATEGVVHLGEIVEIEGDMPFRKMRRTKAELAPRDTVTGAETGTFQMLEIPADGGGKLKVAYIVLKGTPDVIDVHRVSEPRSGTSLSASFRSASTRRRQHQRVG